MTTAVFPDGSHVGMGIFSVLIQILVQLFAGETINHVKRFLSAVRFPKYLLAKATHDIVFC